MFVPVSTLALVQGLRSQSLLALDLPSVQLGAQVANTGNIASVHAHSYEQALVVRAILGVSLRLGAPKIDALNLDVFADSRGYRRSNQGRTPIFPFTSGRGNVVAVDINGRVMLDIDPRYHPCYDLPRRAIPQSIGTGQRLITTRPRATNFQQFGSLAFELQAKIWELASRNNQDSRTIVLAENMDGVWTLKGGPILEMFLAQKRVMADVSAITRLYKPMFGLRGSNKLAYFREDLDILRIDADTSMGFLPQSLLQESLNRRAELSTILHLELGLPNFESNIILLTEDVRCINSLQSLTISGSVASTQNQLVELEYQKIDGDKLQIEPVIQVGAITLSGLVAIETVCRRLLTQQADTDRILSHWDSFQEMYHEIGDSLPESVIIKVQFE